MDYYSAVSDLVDQLEVTPDSSDSGESYMVQGNVSRDVIAKIWPGELPTRKYRAHVYRIDEIGAAHYLGSLRNYEADNTDDVQEEAINRFWDDEETQTRAHVEVEFED